MIDLEVETILFGLVRVFSTYNFIHDSFICAPHFLTPLLNNLEMWQAELARRFHVNLC